MQHRCNTRCARNCVCYTPPLCNPSPNEILCCKSQKKLTGLLLFAELRYRLQRVTFILQLAAQVSHQCVASCTGKIASCNSAFRLEKYSTLQAYYNSICALVYLFLQIVHQTVEEYFLEFDGARYLPRPWLKKVYPHG